MTPLTIIVTAYNRPEALKTLLSSLKAVHCPQNINLLISIDNKGTKEVNEIAREFHWGFGEKKVVIHENKLGLINHFIWVGDQTELYENVLFLEDDMFVSPHIINYSLQAINFYKDDDRIAGCSLYNPSFTLSGMYFNKIEDGYDNFFYQHPYWGNIWFKEKWSSFKTYLGKYVFKKNILPSVIQTWHSGSFKRIYIQYLVETKRTIVYPRLSLLTNMGDPGLHCEDSITFVQVTTLTDTQRDINYNFSSYDNSIARYDAFEELEVDVLKTLNPRIKEYDFIIDTKLNRNYFPSKYVLTTRSVKKPIMSFSWNMKPYEANVIYNIEGDGLQLCDTEDLVTTIEDENRIKYFSLKSQIPAKLRSLYKYERGLKVRKTYKKISNKIKRLFKKS